MSEMIISKHIETIDNGEHLKLEVQSSENSESSEIEYYTLQELVNLDPSSVVLLSADGIHGLTISDIAFLLNKVNISSNSQLNAQ